MPTNERFLRRPPRSFASRRCDRRHKNNVIGALRSISPTHFYTSANYRRRALHKRAGMESQMRPERPHFLRPRLARMLTVVKQDESLHLEERRVIALSDTPNAYLGRRRRPDPEITAPEPWSSRCSRPRIGLVLWQLRHNTDPGAVYQRESGRRYVATRSALCHITFDHSILDHRFAVMLYRSTTLRGRIPIRLTVANGPGAFRRRKPYLPIRVHGRLRRKA